MLATFSLHSVVNDAGSYAGLASLIGLALLVLLYFAQAREIRRLSDWIDEEDERRALSPGPLARATVLAPGVAPPPPSSGAVTTAVPGVRRVAVPPATAAAATVAAGVATPAAVEAAAAASTPLAPAAAPSLPGPPEAEPAPEAPAVPLAEGARETAEPEPVPRPAAAAAHSEIAPPPERAGEVASVPLAGPRVPSAEPDAERLAAAAAAEAGALTAVSPRPAQEPVVEEREPVDEPAPLAPSTAAAARPRFPPQPGVRAAPIAGSASAMMSAGGPRVALEAERDPFVIEPTRRAPGGRGPGAGGPDDPRGRDGGRPPRSPWPALRLLLVAIVIVAVLIFAVTQLFGGNAKTPPAKTGTSTTTTTHHTTGHRTATTKTPPPAPDTITVSVLNGTTVTHLASGAWTKLAARGFKEGAIADAPAQDHVRTIVGYIAGRHAAAVEVAHDLGLSAADARPVDSASLAAGSAGGLAPQVVVTLGSEYANSR